MSLDGVLPVAGGAAWPDTLDPVECASRAELDRLQEAALLSMVEYATRRAPLISETWTRAGVAASDLRSIADFVGMAPFIDKDSVRAFRDRNNDPAGGMGYYGPGEITNVGTTSGTTGDPTPIPGGRELVSDLSYARDLWQLGLRPGDYHSHILFTYRGGHRRRFLQEQGIAEINFSMDPREMPRLCEASRRFRPTTMSIMPNPLLNVLEKHFEETDEDPVDTFKSYKGAIFGGEPLSARLAKLAKSWGLEIYETTSLGDVCGATQCRARDGMHAYEDMAYIECIDPVTTLPVSDGTPGELVVTTLVDRFTPMIRYRTGDLVTLDRSRCGCGRTHVRFTILGRASDETLIQGRIVMPREIMTHVELHEEARTGLFQIIRLAREMDVLRLRVGYDPARLRDGEEKLHQRLTDDLSAKLGVSIAIELVVEQELLKLGPPHKIPRVTTK